MHKNICLNPDTAKSERERDTRDVQDEFLSVDSETSDNVSVSLVGK